MGRKRQFGYAVGLAGWMFSAVLAAQGLGRVEGRLTDTSGHALGGVTVEVTELGVSSSSGVDGAYSLILPDGSHTLTFTAAGYSERLPDVLIALGGATRLDRELDWPLSWAQTAVVSAPALQDQDITLSAAPVNLVKAEELERSAAHGQIAKTLEFETGVLATQHSLHEFSLDTRGFSGSQNRRLALRIDGRDASFRFFGSQEWPALSWPIDDLAQIELVRGPGAVLYGPNTSGGVLHLVTSTARANRGGSVRVSGGELSTINVDLRLSTPIGGQWYAKVLGGYRSSGDFTVSRISGVEYSAPCSTPGETDCLPMEAVALDPEDDNELFSGVVRFDRHSPYGGGLLTIETGISSIEGPVKPTDLGRVQTTDAQWTWLRADYSTEHWEFLGSFNSRDSNSERSLSTGYELSLDDESWQFEGRTNWTLADDRIRLLGGLSYRDETIDTADSEGRTRPSMLNPFNEQTLLFEKLNHRRKAAFGQMDWQLGRQWQFILGARWDEIELPALIPPTSDDLRTSRHRSSELSPKAALVFSPSPNHSLRVGYHESFEIPNYAQYYFQADLADPVNLAFLEPICALDGVPCGFDLDFIFGENPEGDTTPDTRIMAVGNERLQFEEVTTFEIGYTGRLAGNTLLTLDLYSSENTNIVSGLLPQLGTSLGRVNTDFGPYIPPEDLTPEHKEEVLQGLADALGPLLPFLTQNIDGTPFLAMSSYANVGDVDTVGVDFGLRWQSPGGWLVAATTSWFDYDIQSGASDLQQELLPNAPELKASAELGYGGDRWGSRIGYRWVDGFRWKSGPFEGDVESYGVLDLIADVRLGGHWSLGLNVTNLLDEDQWQSFGGDLLGRRGLASVSFAW